MFVRVMFMMYWLVKCHLDASHLLDSIKTTIDGSSLLDTNSKVKHKRHEQQTNIPVKVLVVPFHRGSLHHCSINAISFIRSSFSAVMSCCLGGGRTRSPRDVLGVMVMVLRVSK